MNRHLSRWDKIELSICIAVLVIAVLWGLAK